LIGATRLLTIYLSHSLHSFSNAPVASTAHFFEGENIAVFAVIEFEDEFEARFEAVLNGNVFAS